ncbi:hypothetical protein GA0061081_10678 [Gilliamella bombicola]|uniref:Uncharacterized protein n=1 Tax=Gilliamella bombicola TaxID=1798182 RepID=A0A1C4BZT9_9GAMM|nr:hypothetical protein GA0061081_10678 [Gilliamella bombicola]
MEFDERIKTVLLKFWLLKYKLIIILINKYHQNKLKSYFLHKK